ncbi:MAG: redox-sensing transcriptional repressor Rex [Spirochaetota bacterium]
MDERIHRPMVLRLARYLRVLQKLKGLGFVKVFSNNLGDAIGATPAVVRKDFSVIGITGNKRGGYVIDSLIERLVEVLGKNEVERVVVVGCGRIGSALLNFREFSREGIRVVAGFDIRPDSIDREGSIPVLPMDEFPGFVADHKVEVAVLAVPDQVATSVFELMVDAGIRGVLNFTSVELKCGAACEENGCVQECTVHNVNIGLEIENLFYLIRLKREAAVPETVE